MNVLFYTNCQDSGIRYFLDIFYKDINYSKISNYEFLKYGEGKDIYKDLLREADIFIYQPISKKHGIFSTDNSLENNILSFLPSHCQKISFPYLYNSVIWIIVQPTDIDDFIGDWKNYKKYVNSEPIQKLKRLGYSLYDVQKMYKEGKIDFEYDRRYREYKEILNKKDSECDVKVGDFIIENIRKRRLFFTQNHPTGCIYAHVSNQILNILGKKVQLNIDSYPENLVNFQWQWPHCEYDKKYWNFEFPINYNGNYLSHINNIYNLYF